MASLRMMERSWSSKPIWMLPIQKWCGLISQNQQLKTGKILSGNRECFEFILGGKKIFANYMVDVKTQVKQYDLNGKFERDIELPGIGTAGGIGGKETDQDLYYSFTSFTYPTSILNTTSPAVSLCCMRSPKSNSIQMILKLNKYFI